MSAIMEIKRNRTLAHACLAGDEDAFANIYKQYKERVYNLCLRITRNSGDAADITQETFCAFLNRLQHLDIDSLIVSSYLFATARYRSLHFIEKRRRTSLSDNVPEPMDSKTELEYDPERHALQDVQCTSVISANGRLPERQRVALAMRELEDLSYREIGDVLGLNENAVAQLISRARLRLCQELRSDALVIPAADSECERAIPLILLSVDGKIDKKESRWLKKHLCSCDSCQTNLGAIEEACISYRSMLPVPAALGFAEIASASSGVLAGYGEGAGAATSIKSGVAGWALRGAVVTSVGLIAGAVVIGGGSGDQEESKILQQSAGTVVAAHASTVAYSKQVSAKKSKRPSGSEKSEMKSADRKDPAGGNVNQNSSASSPKARSKKKKKRAASWKSSSGGTVWRTDGKRSPKSGGNQPSNSGSSGNSNPGSQPKNNPQPAQQNPQPVPKNEPEGDPQPSCEWISETACQ